MAELPGRRIEVVRGGTVVHSELMEGDKMMMAADGGSLFVSRIRWGMGSSDGSPATPYDVIVRHTVGQKVGPPMFVTVEPGKSREFRVKPHADEYPFRDFKFLAGDVVKVWGV